MCTFNLLYVYSLSVYIICVLILCVFIVYVLIIMCIYYVYLLYVNIYVLMGSMNRETERKMFRNNKLIQQIHLV